MLSNAYLLSALAGERLWELARKLLIPGTVS